MKKAGLLIGSFIVMMMVVSQRANALQVIEGADYYDKPAKVANELTVTLTYGSGKKLTIQAPPEDILCIAQREAKLLKADKMIVPAGTYPAVCDDTDTITLSPTQSGGFYMGTPNDQGRGEAR